MTYDSLAGEDYLPQDLRDRIESELASGERLVWSGQPRARSLAIKTIPLVLFGIPWTAFSLFWVYMASGGLFGLFGKVRGFHPEGGARVITIVFPLFGLPFVLIGLGLLSAPYWAARRARRTCYALTDRRAIVWIAGWFGRMQVRSFGPEDLGRITRIERADGSGDLIFEEALVASFAGSESRGTRLRYRGMGFLGIGRVRQVEDLIRRTLLAH